MLRSRTLAALLATSALSLIGCVSDSKGESCGLLDVFVDPDTEESYCPDEEAPEACEVMADSAAARVDSCFEGLVAEDDPLRVDFRENAKDVLRCEEAVAISLDYDACLAALEEEPDCEAVFDGVDGAAVPVVCEGVVFVDSGAP